MVTLKVFTFGQFQIESGYSEEKKEAIEQPQMKEPIEYSVPTTTYTPLIEIDF